MLSRRRIVRALAVIGLSVALTVPAGADTVSPITNPPGVSQLLPPLLTPVTTTLTGLLNLLTSSRDMKLLVLSADGTEPSFAAIQAILTQIGVPYDAVILTHTKGALPPLNNALKG